MNSALVALIGMPVFLVLMNVYVFLRLKKYINICFKNKYINIGYIAVWVIFVASILYSAIYKGNYFGKAFSIYTAIFIYVLMAVVLLDIICLIKKNIDKRKLSLAVLSFTIVVIIYGFINAYIIDIKNYNISIDKNIESLKIVQISDTHYGSNMGKRMARQMVDKINAQNPDIVLYTGDFIDGNYEWISDPNGIADILTDINSKYGVYACWGNHDTFYDADKVKSFLDKANVKLLEDESELINDKFYIVGKYDSSNSNNIKPVSELTKNIDKSKPIILISHRPEQLAETSECGVDIMLSGHTHNGQTFPFNLIMGNFWQNPYGLKEFGNMQSIVTSGVGLWGPTIRVGTNSEIAVISVTGF